MQVAPDAPRRPALRYYGGKWKLAPWIISHFPPHRVYTEAYGGAASVLLRKPRAYAEVYNDMDGEIVNLFRVLRNPSEARELRRQVKLTPFARREFEASYLPDGDPVEQARRTLLRSFAGFGSGAACGHQTGFRSNVTRSGTVPAADWAGLPDILAQVAARFQGVVVENDHALAVLERYDTASTLHYIDPPYPLDTRNLRGHHDSIYRHEMTNEDHRQMAKVIIGLQGMVVISGYECPLYTELFSDWPQRRRQARADGAGARTEVLWFNEAAWAALHNDFSDLALFNGL